MSDEGTMEQRWSDTADREEIREVVYRYCRGVDRRQFDIVRSCYHPDGWDDHGDFKGNLDDFIAFITMASRTWDVTTHFVGNLHIELDGDRARVESYTVATHRMFARGDKPLRDFVAAFRYVDDFERRDGQWRVAVRVCVVDWTRVDAQPRGPWPVSDQFTQGRHDLSDPVFAPRLADL